MTDSAGDLEDVIARYAAVTQEAREAASELHGLLKDLRHERQAARKLLDEVVARDVRKAVTDTLATDLTKIRSELVEVETVARDAINARFDVFAAMLMGEDRHSVVRGLPPMAQLIRHFCDTNGISVDDLMLKDATEVPAGLRRGEQATPASGSTLSATEGSGALSTHPRVGQAGGRRERKGSKR